MHFTNKTQCSLPIAVWLLTSDYGKDIPKEQNIISATDLLKSTRQLILQKRIKDENIELQMDIIGLLASKMGSALHDAIERSWTNESYKEALKTLGYSEKSIDRIKVNVEPEDLNPGDIPLYLEKRTTKAFLNYHVTGKLDAVFNGVLTDYKSTSVFTYTSGYNEKKYALQGSIYRWLNPTIVKSDFLNIQFIFKDWKESESIRNSSYPNSPVFEQKIPLLSIDETERYVEGKINELNTYKDVDETLLPLCTREELWQKESEFKVYANKDSKRAVKAGFKSVDEAQLYITINLPKSANYIIKEIIGEPVACKYCRCTSICSQYIKYIAEQESENFF